MATPYAALRTSAGPVEAPKVSDINDVKVLTGTTQETFTVPAGSRFVWLAGSVNFGVRRTGNAAWPAADVSDGTGIMIIPATGMLLDVQGVATLSVVAAAGGIVTASWYT